MATQRKPARSRPKAKKAARPVARAAKSAKPAAKKPMAKAKPAAKVAAKAAPKIVAKAGLKPALKGGKIKLKSAQRPPAVVHPIGVLPPESISHVSHKPARPVPLPPRPVARKAKDGAADGAGQPVTKKDFNEFEQRLLEERGRVLKEMGHYESTVLKVNQRDSAGDLSGYSFHMADVGTDAMEREKAFQLASAEGRILLEINEALRRMARGEYGVCESCGNPILRARLEAMPTARLCLSCKEKEERAARGIS